MSRKIVAITGTTRGLGCAMTEEFIRHGYAVAGCGRDPVAIQKLSELFPTPHYFASLNVADYTAVDKWAAHVLASIGTPDILICNAGIINPNAPLWEVDPATLSQVVDVNIKGVAFANRAFLPAIIRRGSGTIINFSSGWGRSTSPDVAPYCATKWAVEGLTQALSQELPRGIAAVAMNPGVIDTDMLRSCFGESAAHYPDPAEWARIAVPFFTRITSKDNGKQMTVPHTPVD